jgi:hypothetical protein
MALGLGKSQEALGKVVPGVDRKQHMYAPVTSQTRGIIPQAVAV